jgi:hypothetical protein
MYFGLAAEPRRHGRDCNGEVDRFRVGVRQNAPDARNKSYEFSAGARQ